MEKSGTGQSRPTIPRMLATIPVGAPFTGERQRIANVMQLAALLTTGGDHGPIATSFFSFIVIFRLAQHKL